MKAFARSTMMVAFLALPAIAAAANTAFAPGMVIKDASSAVVGTIVAVNGDTVTVRTTKHEVAVPASSIGNDRGVLLLGMSAAQLDSAYEAAAAKASATAAAQIVVGASIKGKQGTVIGQIVEIGADNVVVALADGTRVALPRNAVYATADGVMIGISAEELKSKIKG